MNNNFHFFDSFNARHSSSIEIAETFVCNEDFFKISQNNHTFVLGPRGCGKTTMFKMLTEPCQKNWLPKNENEKKLKRELPFIAIYIPSDELWKDQLKKITSPIIKDKELVDFISNALVNLNILANFCTNIKDYLQLNNLYIENNKQYDFCIKLIKSWELENCVATLNDVLLAINNRKEKLLNKLKSFMLNRKYNPTEKLDFEDYYHTDFIDSIKNGIIAFEDVYFDGVQKKWALCFDELELVMDSFIILLINKLRTTPPNIVFKLSSGPMTEFFNNSAQIFHDYEVVKMWPYTYNEENRYMSFCEEIASVRLESYFKKNNIQIKSLDLNKIFGELDFKKTLLDDFKYKIKDVKEFEEGSLTWNAFKDLASKDYTFHEYLVHKKVDPLNPIPTNDSTYSSVHRKVKEIVINRLVFNSYKEGKYNGQRSRKEYLIYYGKDSILRICEGNPRFIINIINGLLSEIETSKNNTSEIFFNPLTQSKVIKSVSERFNAMLNTYPTSSSYKNKNLDLRWLINQLGKHFEKEINQGPFKDNPTSSFLINTNSVRPIVFNLLKIGVGLGAFIKIDKTKDEIDTNNLTRFRLTYLLNPEFKLPLRLYSSKKIDNIIKDLPQYEKPRLDTPNLFNNNEN